MNYIVCLTRRKETLCLDTSEIPSKFIWFREYKILNPGSRKFAEIKPYLMSNYV